MKTEDGGPAFPRNVLDHGHGIKAIHESGMTLRDYFASKAMEADIKEYMPETVCEAAKLKEQLGFEPTRQWARYQHADAMLKARKN
jgi:hypothetical protein